MLSLVFMNGSHHPLSARQREILTLCVKLSDKEIAMRLGISTHTVDNHLRKAFDKLGARSRMEAVLLAVYRQELQLADLVSAAA